MLGIPSDGQEEGGDTTYRDRSENMEIVQGQAIKGFGAFGRLLSTIVHVGLHFCEWKTLDEMFCLEISTCSLFP